VQGAKPPPGCRGRAPLANSRFPPTPADILVETAKDPDLLAAAVLAIPPELVT
jgi:hypothetical protein